MSDVPSPLVAKSRKVRWIIVIVLPVLFIVTCAIGLLVCLSPGMPKPYVDAHGAPVPGSISEKTKVDIGGVEQGMFIRGSDVRNPVLLYLHGGLPDYFLTERYPTGLDEQFTVVWWEQRGSGLSYSADLPPESVNPGQLVSDTVEVTEIGRAHV